MKYYKTNLKVQVGDLIEIKPIIFGKSCHGMVIYVPGQTQKHLELGDDQWAYKIKGKGIYVGGYFPNQIPYLTKRIKLIKRNTEVDPNELLIPDEDENAREEPLDLLKLIGCGIVGIFLIFGVIFGVVWLMNR